MECLPLDILVEECGVQVPAEVVEDEVCEEAGLDNKEVA